MGRAATATASTRHPPARTPEITAALDALAQLYAELETALLDLGLECRACGHCCDFEAAGHTLFVSTLELLWLRARSGPRRPGGAGAPCPYQEDGRCAARAGRMLGCRLYFCRVPANAQRALEALSTDCHARLQRLHQQAGVPWNYRPLAVALLDTEQDCR